MRTITAPATRPARLRGTGGSRALRSLPRRRDPAGERLRLGSPISVGVAHEDECRAGHDRGTGADERHVGVLDLARSGAARCLQGTLDDVPEAVDASGAEAAAKGVERQLAVEFDAAGLDEIECGAFLAEAVGFETVDHRGREAVIDLGHIDVLRTEAGALPGQLRRAAAAPHVIAEAANAARHLA